MKARILTLAIVVIAVLTAGTIASPAGAVVNLNIGINAGPPAYVFHAPPPVVVIPGTYVYSVPDIGIPVLFYGGYWWRPYEGRWYRADGYNGPWTYIVPARVPGPLVTLPPAHYHRIPPGHPYIPYGQLKKHWVRWERERYWDRHDHWREDRRSGDHWKHAGHHEYGHPGKHGGR